MLAATSSALRPVRHPACIIPHQVVPPSQPYPDTSRRCDLPAPLFHRQEQPADISCAGPDPIIPVPHASSSSPRTSSCNVHYRNEALVSTLDLETESKSRSRSPATPALTSKPGLPTGVPTIPTLVGDRSPPFEQTKTPTGAPTSQVTSVGLVESSEINTPMPSIRPQTAGIPVEAPKQRKRWSLVQTKSASAAGSSQANGSKRWANGSILGHSLVTHKRPEYRHSNPDTPSTSPLNITHTHTSNASTLPVPPSHPANLMPLPGSTVRYHRHTDIGNSHLQHDATTNNGVNSGGSTPAHKGIQNAATGVTSSPWTLPAVNPGEHEHQWGAQADSDGPAPIALGMVSSYAPSIFDTVQSDDNESYIIWSSPPASSPRKLSTSAASPRSAVTASTETTAATTASAEAKAAVALPLPMPKLAHLISARSSSGASLLASASLHLAPPLPPVASVNQPPSSVMQDRSLLRRWSVGEAFKGKDKYELESFPPSKQIPKDDMGSRGAGAGRAMESVSSKSQLRLLKASATARTENEHDYAATSSTTTSASQPTKKSTISPSATLDEKNRVIMAATVEKLVEKLTSEIDYTFLTDFFLIYRLFITPMALLNLFVLRFHWALIDDSPQRQIVRIRTFVTLRHWLLNYFGFDFMRSKDLRRTLSLHLRSLTKHPLVVSSTRDQRIIKELRRYAQSLKKIQYRRMAQQKLERQSRRLVERHRRLRARPTSSYSYREVSAEWCALQTSNDGYQRAASNNLFSAMVHGNSSRGSDKTGPLTEELTVEFRSSDQSESDDFAIDESLVEDEDEEEYGNVDDEFEPSSENSLYQSESDSEYSMPADDGPEDVCSTSDGDSVGDQRGHVADSESESVASAEDQTPFGGVSTQLQEEGHGLFQSQHPSRSADSPTASRSRGKDARPVFPDFTGVNRRHPLKLDSPNPSYSRSMSGKGRSRANIYSRPLSTQSPVVTPLSLPGLHPTTDASIRSIEPYINPPPRSIVSVEKRTKWSKYMSATVGRLSKVKNVFSSSATSKTHKRARSSTFTHSTAGINASSVNDQLRSSRYWQGRRSDPESDKLSHYLLRSCTGMNMLLSSSEVHRQSFDHRFTTERDQQREQAGSDWSSDDDYSQYEMTRRSSRLMYSRDDDPCEEQDVMDLQLLEMRLEPAQYPPFVDVTPTILETVRDGQGRGLGTTDHGLEADKDERSECERARCLACLFHLQQACTWNSGGQKVPLNDGAFEHEATFIAGQGTSESQFSERVADRQVNDMIPTETLVLSQSIETRPISSQDQHSPWVMPPSTSVSEFAILPSSHHHSYHTTFSSQGAADRIPSHPRNSRQDYLLPPRNYYRTKAPQHSIVEESRRRSLDTAAEITLQQSLASETAADRGIEKPAGVHLPQLDGQSQLFTSAPAEIYHLTVPSVYKNQTCSHHHYCHCHQQPPERNTRDVTTTRRHSSHIHSRGSWSSTAGVTIPTLDHFSMSPGVTASSSNAPLPFPIQLQSQHSVPIKPIFCKGRSKSQPQLSCSIPASVMNAHSDRPAQHTVLDKGSHIENGRQHVHSQQQPRDYAPASSAPRETSSLPYPFLQDDHRAGHNTQQYQYRQWQEATGAHPPFSQGSRIRPFVLRYRSELIAQQLCLIEREMLNHIQWHELVDAGWTKKNNPTTSSSNSNVNHKHRPSGAATAIISTSVLMDVDKHKGSGSKKDGYKMDVPRVPTPTTFAKGGSALDDGKRRGSRREDSAGIKSLVDRFNLTCQWVTSEIVRTQDIDMRVKVVEKFIRIAHTCYNHSNFSSLIQVMLGLQAHSVSRLGQTWARVRAQETRIMHDLVEFTSPFHNWKHLRDAMKNIADEWGGSSGGIAASIPPPPEKLSSRSGGVTFFSIATPRVRTTESAKDLEASTATMASLSASYISNQQSRRRGSATPILASTPSPAGKDKDRERDRQLGETETVKSTQQGGCIPFLGLYLADLVFNSELPSFVEPKNHPVCLSSLGSDDTSGKGSSRPLVNVHKHRTTATIIKRVLTFRTLAGRYPFQPEPEVRDLLLAIEGVDPAEMLLLSNACEERMPDTAR